MLKTRYRRVTAYRYTSVKPVTGILKWMLNRNKEFKTWNRIYENKKQKKRSLFCETILVITDRHWKCLFSNPTSIQFPLQPFLRQRLDCFNFLIQFFKFFLRVSWHAQFIFFIFCRKTIPFVVFRVYFRVKMIVVLTPLLPRIRY